MDMQVGDKVTYKIREIVFTEIINNLSWGVKLKNDAMYEILKIERPKYEVVEEKKELLTEEEREFLKQYIKLIGFEKDVGYIKKSINRFLYVILSDDSNFEIEVSYGENFKNLENEKVYTLKELGLEEN